MWLSSITVKRNRGANVIRNLIQEAPLSQREAARCFVSVSSFIQHVHRNLLLLVTSASDLPLRAIKFCSVLFSSAYSLMRAWRVGLCHKQTCYILLHRRPSIVDRAVIDPIAIHSSIIAIFATPLAFGAPIRGPSQEYCKNGKYWKNYNGVIGVATRW